MSGPVASPWRGRKGRRRQGGFTLIELAVVLMVIGLFVGAGVYGLQSYREHARIMNTETNLRRVEAAITNFVAYRGRLPRPTATAGDGDEGAVGGGDATAGFLPWQAMGLSAADARDGRDQWLRYVVDNESADDDEPLACDGEFGEHENHLYLRDADGNPAGVGEENVVYVVYSVGADRTDQTELTAGVAYAANGGDDTAIGRSADQVLIDSGCRVKTADWNPCGEGGCGGDPDRDGPAGGQMDFNDRALHKYWGGAYEGYNTSTEDIAGRHSYEPDVVDGAMKYGDAPDWTEWQTGSMRSCLWPAYDLRLEDSDIRAYFRVAAQEDTMGILGDGMTMAFLPWEVATRTDAYSSANICGEEGPHLGFGSKSGTPGYTLTPVNEFESSTPSAGIAKERAAFGVELDLQSDVGPHDGRTFDDPPHSTGGAEENHTAIDLENTYHDPSGSQGLPNPACEDDDASCSLPDGTGAMERHWLEQGISAYHQVRVEVLDGPTAACPADDYDGDGEEDDPVEVRAMVWPAGTSCTAGCADLSQSYRTLLGEDEDSAMRLTTRCLAKPTRTIAMGSGWELGTWSKLKPGYTVSLAMHAEDRTELWIRDFVATSATSWAARPAAGAMDTSVEFGPALFDQTSEMNWDIIDRSGGYRNNPKQVWTGTSWLSFPDQGVDLTAYRGEIVVGFDESQGPVGWGIKGVGGTGQTYWPAAEIDNIDDPDERQGDGYRESLLFTFDKTYRKTQVLLSLLNGGERARLRFFKIGGPAPASTSPRPVGTEMAKGPVYEATVQACNGGGDMNSSDTFVSVTVPGDFDTIQFEPIPQADNDASGFLVWKVKACGENATCTVTRTGGHTQWWPSFCAVSATATVVGGTE